MAGKFFVVTLNCAARPVPNDAIERMLGSYDWLRFSADTYYVYSQTVTNPMNVYALVKSVIHADDQVVVVEIQPQQRYGWTSQVAIEWFNKARA
jgi:hypothetical protein